MSSIFNEKTKPDYLYYLYIDHLTGIHEITSRQFLVKYCSNRRSSAVSMTSSDTENELLVACRQSAAEQNV